MKLVMMVGGLAFAAGLVACFFVAPMVVDTRLLRGT